MVSKLHLFIAKIIENKIEESSLQEVTAPRGPSDINEDVKEVEKADQSLKEQLMLAKVIVSTTLVSSELSHLIAKFNQKKFYTDLFQKVNEHPELTVRYNALDVAIDTFVKSKEKPDTKVNNSV